MKFWPLFLISGIFVATAWADEQPMVRSVSVSGEASILAPPDRATVRASVQSRNTDLESARSQVVRVSGRFLDLCRKLRIDESKVTTTGLSIQPEYRWDQNTREQLLVGYFVSRELIVELEDIELLGRLIEGAVDAGVNQVSPPVLGSSQRKKFHRQALAAATEDARLNAQAIAATLGARLGTIRSIDTGAGVVPIPLARGRMEMMGADVAPETTYQAGDLEFTARVSATFDLLTE